MGREASSTTRPRRSPACDSSAATAVGWTTDVFDRENHQANAPINSPNGSFTPALFWDNGIPPFATGPIYDQTYQTGFATGLGNGGTLTYGNPNSVPPRYTNWNFSIQRSLTRSTVLTGAYVGSTGKSLAGAAPGFWTNQMDPKYLALGNLLTQTATPANVAAAAAIIPGIKLPYANFSGTIGQMLKPWPQYTSIGAPYNNDGQLNYQALQASLQQRLRRGLTFNVNYSFSKALGTINGFRSAYIGEKNLSTTDIPHVWNAFYSYDLASRRASAFIPAGGGLWGRRGASIAADGTVYLGTGDAQFDSQNRRLGNGIVGVKLDANKQLQLGDYFAAPNANWLWRRDLDVNTTPVVIDYRGGKFLVGTSKECRLWLLDSDAMGGEDHRTDRRVGE